MKLSYTSDGIPFYEPDEGEQPVANPLYPQVSVQPNNLPLPVQQPVFEQPQQPIQQPIQEQQYLLPGNTNQNNNNQLQYIPVDHNPWEAAASRVTRKYENRNMASIAPTSPMDQLFTAEDRFQTWPEKMIRSAVTLPGDVYSGKVPTNLGLRREDFTDIPPPSREDVGNRFFTPIANQPNDAIVERAQDVAGMAGGTMFGIKPGVGSVGSGPLMKMGTEVAPNEVVPTFYSAVEHAVANIPQAKMPAEQWLGTLSNKPGVKPEELDWIGLKDFLAEKKGQTVTKQEVQDFVNANKVELKEVSKGTKSYDELTDEFENQGHPRGTAEEMAADALTGENGTKYHGYQLPGGPLSRDTEILTRNGWKRIDIVSIHDVVMTRKDDGELEWQPVQAVPTMYADKLYHFFNQSVDMQVTSNHNMVVKRRRRSSKGLFRVTAQKLWDMSECVIPLTGQWKGKGTGDIFGMNARDVAEFVGWYLAEGSYKHNNKGVKNTIQLAQCRVHNPENCERLEDLFDRLGLIWKYYGDGYGIGSKTMNENLLYLLHSQPTSEAKYIPKFFFNQSREVLECLLEGLVLGDGHTTKEGVDNYESFRQSRRMFFSKSKQLADDVQVLALLTGYRASVRKRPSGIYCVGISLRDWNSVDDAKHAIVDYNDIAYCVTVENHCIYVRRNGVAAFTGNSDYREMLLTLPSKEAKPTREMAINEAKRFSQHIGEDWNKVPVIQQEHYINSAMEELLKKQRIDGDGVNYKSSHWDEPNVLAHVRMNDRVMPLEFTVEEKAALQAHEKAQPEFNRIRKEQDKIALQIQDASKPFEAKRRAQILADNKAGKLSNIETIRKLESYEPSPDLIPLQKKLADLRTQEDALRATLPEKPVQKNAKSLHIEEIQSDWHQQGRDKGYEGSDDQHSWELKNNEMKAIQEKRNNIIEKLKDNPSDEEMTKSFKQIDDRYKSINAELRELEKNVKYGVPDAPFKKSWHELALKRMIREAAEGGYSRLSWTPGEAQAARYDLSKHVDKVNLIPVEQIGQGFKFRIDAFKDNNKVIEHYAKNEDEISSVVGKEVAKKLLDNRNNHGAATASGLDLKVGGEGMKGFYDQIIPKAIEKIGKEHGVKVKQGEIPLGGIKQDGISHYWYHPDMKGSWKTKAEAEKALKQPIHYIDIPQSLKDTATKRGFPLFSSGVMYVPVDHNPFSSDNGDNSK